MRPDRLRKTTYARRLEAGGAVRLSVDEEVYARHGRYGLDCPMEEYVDRERPVVQELRRRLVELPEALRQRLADRNRRGDANALMVSPSALEDVIARFHEPVDAGEELVAAQPPG